MKLGDQCKKGKKNMTDAYGLLVLRPLRFRSTLTKRGVFLFWSKVKFINRDPHWNRRRVKEAIHISLHPNYINRDSGIDIPEAWIPTVKQSNTRFKRTCEGTTSNNRNNNKDRNTPITANQCATNSDT